MNNQDFVNAVINAYGQIVAAAAPIAAFIAACNIGINLILKAFTGHDLRIGGDR